MSTVFYFLKTSIMINKNEVIKDLKNTGVTIPEHGINVTIEFCNMADLGTTLVGLASVSELLAQQLLGGEESPNTAIAMLTVAELMGKLIQSEHYAIIDKSLLNR